MNFTTLGPSADAALHSLDFGEVVSPDGRAHPLDALTPVSIYPVPSDAAGPVAPTSGTTGPGNGGGPIGAGAALFPSSSGGMFSLPSHFGSRVVVSVVAIGLILIVAWRLAR